MSDEVTKTAVTTNEAISKIIEAKLHGAKPTTINTGDKSDATYVRYTPTSVLDNSSGTASKQRIIKIVDKQVDPMLPPSFKIRKTPQGPSEAPVPILHEQSTAKLTNEDQKKWYIPPAVSNWKNTKGFTIAIDKRMAGVGVDADADVMSNNFGSLAEALENASKKAKEELKLRSKLKNDLESQRVLDNQERLNRIAMEARSGKRIGHTSNRLNANEEEEEDPTKLSAANERERARAERRRKAEKELRLGSMSTEYKVKLLARDQGRDISDRVALGIAKPNEGKKAMENRYDSRLFLNAAGANARHSEDQVYDSPLFAAQDAINDIYRARSGGTTGEDQESAAEEKLNRLGEEKRFESLSSGSADNSKRGAMQGPVTFETDNSSGEPSQEKRVYGLDERNTKRRHK
ncbi:hypothetical protein CANARDRAFT_29732 [[Candida] arabinofermentans NRRL YB-2248]|uniref:Pre-mRNA-processing protein 45 n=1 Tax=[Candida] arabinofermentans NRRL YB-2248 TaxID=983967 RepID=A0A1E4SW68_9ASCO|nr:hypothetical protein CANARDRAFT_29732 [[Candida] arabinofermentans NRRL YB-2248]